MLRPSTKTRCFFGSTALTVPVLPLSLPVITLTVSPLRIFKRCAIGYRASRAGEQQAGRDSGEVTMLLQNLRRQRDDLHEVAVGQPPGNRAEDARAAWVVAVVDDHGRVLVEG